MTESHSDKKIAVLGAGAVGSFYGGMLAKSGFDVNLIARGEHLNALQSKGLRIESYKYGNFDLQVKADGKLKDIYDVIIVSTKSEDTAGACENIGNHLDKDGFVVSLQNGVDNIKTISQFLSIGKIIPSRIYVGLSITAPGVVKHSAEGILGFGAADETDKSYVDAFEKILSETELEYKVEEDILQAQWKKLLWNLAFNPLSALLESTCGKLSHDEEINDLMHKIVDEGVRAARYRGVDVPEAYAASVPDRVKGLENFKTSMLQDIEKGKNPEIDGIILPVITTLNEYGQEAAYCETIYKSLKFKYGKKFIYTPKLTVDMIVENDSGEILLIERKNPPYGWALPGGFVDYGEKVENAAVRELAEETGISVSINKINLLGVYSDPLRDPRGHTASVVYYVKANAEAEAADDAKEAAFFAKSNIPENIAFDHRKILYDYFDKLSVKRKA